MSTYSFQNQAFEIQQYDKQKTFASFLPGLAGKRGIPLWAFYVNRGQAISSFGVRDKNGAILEFFPANLAYTYVAATGFRTFIKQSGKVQEIFDVRENDRDRVMKITPAALGLEERRPEEGYLVKVRYFGLPTEDVAALVRRVEIQNITNHPISIEVMDGLAQILPSGIDYGTQKAISNLLRSWMNVEGLPDGFAFYKLRSSLGDEAETKAVKDGNFYVSYVDGELTTPIADVDLVFDYDTALSEARHFQEKSISHLTQERQITENKVPCGFTPVAKTLAAGESIHIDTLIGYTKDQDALRNKLHAFASSDYFAKKEQEANAVIDELLQDVQTKTAYPLFDAYIQQNYLDNLLRGGFPMTIPAGEKSFVYYLYSRKHGDLERDYNFFTIAPEFYSQGNGNFRDVCQNRRSDVLIHPEIKDFNIEMFASLIQADGYNPLSINGSRFELKDKSEATSLAKSLYGDAHPELVSHLQGMFTPGSVINLSHRLGLTSHFSDENVLSTLLSHANQHLEASFGEGYWVDHWTYILDLVENYAHIYPDHMDDLLFRESKFAYYNSPVSVYPRSEKTVIDNAGHVHQYGALRHPDHEKIAAFKMNEHGTNWMTNVSGETMYTTLYAKLFVLAFNKYATLDPIGVGVEMEANKPGWNDAMNGLPGLFGSGVSETIELHRLVNFLIQRFEKGAMMELPATFVKFVEDVMALSDDVDFARWDQVSTLRESYRETLRKPIEKTVTVNLGQYRSVLQRMQAATASAIDKAYQIGKGIVPTYLIFDATKFEEVLDATGKPVISHYGLPKAVVKEFFMRPLPYFLEAPARLLKVDADAKRRKTMISKIDKTDLLDPVLKQYRTSVDLDDWGYDIGRIRAFTKGWLERESNFLHMSYKYLLGVLKSGEYETFFEMAKSNLVYLMNPETYGRSTLENSSFIATSNNPNPKLFGQGFVSRLSGSTAEMLSMWHLLMFGKTLYHMENGNLALTLSTLLPKEYFMDGVITTTFHGVQVIYRNPEQKDGYTLRPIAYELVDASGKRDVVHGKSITGELAKAVRNKTITHITVHLAS